MKRLGILLTVVAIAVNAMATDGALSGKFSVAANKQVVFSQGNLQYLASTNTWRFAENQYDTIGADNANISSTYTGWLDLFGWGTGNNPTLSSMEDSDYQTFTDWGVNPISNGGNQANQWRTLTGEEWEYIFHGRSNAQNLFGLGSVNGVNGTIILPDNWTTPSGLVFYASTAMGMSWLEYGVYYDSARKNHFVDNAYTSSEWLNMEAAGAVFLPTSGARGGTGVEAATQCAKKGTFYWSTTTNNVEEANGFGFSLYGFLPQTAVDRYYGFSVRLVKDVK